jgi:hypothetical protein
MTGPDRTTHVGFTGTRKGMTQAQMMAFLGWLGQREPGALHHGDCLGADAQAHEIARDLGWRIVLHPPSDQSLRAFSAVADEVRQPRPYLERNACIVDEAEVLLAAPAEAAERQRSGTWATVRYMRLKGKQVVIIEPDGATVSDRTRQPSTLGRGGQ